MLQKVKPHLPYLAVIWILTLGIYLKTASPAILFIDAGTHLAAAKDLGISNPPGFPLYIMIAHLFTKIPFGSVIFRMQILSEVSAAGVLTLVYFLVQRLITTNKDTLSPGFIRAVAFTGALSLAFSYEFWSQSTNTESYILTNLSTLTLLILLVTVPREGVISFKRILAGSVIFGLSTGFNPTIAQTVPALVLGGVFLWRRVRFWHVIVAILVVIALTATVYSYLPIRARAYPFTNWGNPQTWELFWGHIRGEGLNIYDPRTNSVNGFTGSIDVFSQSIGRYVYLFLIQFTPFMLPFIFLGLYYLFKKDKHLFFILVAIPVANAFFGGLYLSGNQESWFIASYVISSIFLGAGIAFCAKVLIAKKLSVNLLILIILLIPTIPLFWWFPKLDRSGHIFTKEYADNLYRNLEKGAVLIGTGDFFNSMSHFEYVVNGRKDVFPVTVNMWYILPWYRDTLRHHRPDLIPDVLETMIKKDRYEEYNEVLNWWIKWLVDRGVPVYVTPMVFRESVLAGTDAGQYIIDKNILKGVPDGLVIRILTAKDLLQPNEDHFQYQFVDSEFYKKPPFYLERNYKAGWKLLLREYGLGFMEYGNYLATTADKKTALKYFERAYEIAPSSLEVVNRLAVFLATDLKNPDAALKYFREAEELEPDNFDLRLNLAIALRDSGDMEQATKELQYITDNADTPAMRDKAIDEIANIRKLALSQVPSDWKKYRGASFSFAYPPDLKTKVDTSGVLALGDQRGELLLYLYSGDFSKGGVEEWLSKSPLKFSGNLVNQGPAKIPGFNAMLRVWAETDGTETFEFILTRDTKIFHIRLRSSPEKMSIFDRIVSTLDVAK